MAWIETIVQGLGPIWIWAQVRPAIPAKLAPTSWYWNAAVSTALVIAVVAGVVGVFYLRKDVSTADDAVSVTEEEQLAEFERSYEAGEMEEAEIRRVRDLLRRKQGLSPLPSASLDQLGGGPEIAPEAGEEPPAN